jgi:gluconokinase
MVIVLMGVVGSGKTTVGTLLAGQLGWQFADADDFHPPANKNKIHRGIPLTDADREPWLASLAKQISEWNAARINAVLACSALKESYRRQLQAAGPVVFVYLKGTPELIGERLRQRHGHFADGKILTSQFEDLEEPADAIVVDISPSPDEIVNEIRRKLGLE